MLERLADLQRAALADIEKSNASDDLQEVRVAYLGKKGGITAISRSMGEIAPEERPAMGQAVNEVKDAIEEAIEKKMRLLAEGDLLNRLKAEKVDVSLPGKKLILGSKHPLTLITEEIEDIFLGLGYTIAEGPQVETDYYNFEALNTPKEHPAREMQDTFYFNDNLLLRTQTSAVQGRVMEKVAPELPLKIICPGVVYRRDDDVTHSPMFRQVEGLYVDKKVTFGDLKGTLLTVARKMFGEEREIRLRPSYFPFTEPSAEVDISCFNCGGQGCRLCKGTGWIEILGSGMVHPNVLAMSGYNPEEAVGFAFGMGVERIAMLKYGITDMRILFENDQRFLAQF